LGDLGVDGRIIFKRILNKQGVDYVQPVYDRVQWLTFGNLLKNLGVWYQAGYFPTTRTML
jgi:hypothetical protein